MKINATDYTPADILKMIREWTELTQEEFGESIGVTRKVIRNMEQGITDIKLDAMLSIAKKHKLKIIIEKDD